MDKLDNEGWLEIWGSIEIADELNEYQKENIILEVYPLTRTDSNTKRIEPGVLVHYKRRDNKIIDEILINSLNNKDESKK